MSRNPQESIGKLFHGNDNYEVVVNAEGDGYDVVNSNSGIIEFKSESLPECIFAAENLNVVLVHRTFEWVGKRAQEKAIADSGISIASVHEIN